MEHMETAAPGASRGGGQDGLLHRNHAIPTDAKKKGPRERLERVGAAAANALRVLPVAGDPGYSSPGDIAAEE